jgi:hypothetical protein
MIFTWDQNVCCTHAYYFTIVYTLLFFLFVLVVYIQWRSQDEKKKGGARPKICFTLTSKKTNKQTKKQADWRGGGQLFTLYKLLSFCVSSFYLCCFEFNFYYLVGTHFSAVSPPASSIHRHIIEGLLTHS